MSTFHCQPDLFAYFFRLRFVFISWAWAHAQFSWSWNFRTESDIWIGWEREEETAFYVCGFSVFSCRILSCSTHCCHIHMTHTETCTNNNRNRVMVASEILYCWMLLSVRARWYYWAICVTYFSPQWHSPLQFLIACIDHNRFALNSNRIYFDAPIQLTQHFHWFEMTAFTIHSIDCRNDSMHTHTHEDTFNRWCLFML